MTPPEIDPNPSPLSAELGPTPDPTRAVDALWKVYGIVNEWIRFADVKAGALLTANAVITVAVIALLKQYADYFHDHPYIRMTAIIGLFGMGGSAIACLYCINPWVTLAGAEKSLIYFDHVADFESPSDYRGHISKMADEAFVLQDLTGQVWVNSQIARVKYRSIKFAAYLFKFAILAGVVVACAAISHEKW